MRSHFLFFQDPQCVKDHDSPRKGYNIKCFPSVFHHITHFIESLDWLAYHRCSWKATILVKPFNFLNSGKLVLGIISHSLRTHCLRWLVVNLQSSLSKFEKEQNINRFRTSSEQIYEWHTYHSLPKETRNGIIQHPGRCHRCHLACFQPAPLCYSLRLCSKFCGPGPTQDHSFCILNSNLLQSGNLHSIHSCWH